MEEMTFEKANKILVEHGRHSRPECVFDCERASIFLKGHEAGFPEGRKSLLQDPRLKRMVKALESMDCLCIDDFICQAHEAIKGYKELLTEIEGEG